MRIAVVTDDEKTISAHFGRAQYYLVFEIENGKVISKETRPKANHNQFADAHDHHHEPGHAHGMGPRAQHRHGQMLENIKDCKVLLARGMGQGAHSSLKSNGIQPVLTDIQDIQEAVDAYLAGTLVENLQRLH
ncbi:MAG: NifB/NifX family molybdenum-iron cluster-binding protein [Anaerolineales bacterium]